MQDLGKSSKSFYTGWVRAIMSSIDCIVLKMAQNFPHDNVGSYQLGDECTYIIDSSEANTHFEMHLDRSTSVYWCFSVVQGC